MLPGVVKGLGTFIIIHYNQIYSQHMIQIKLKVYTAYNQSQQVIISCYFLSVFDINL